MAETYALNEAQKAHFLRYGYIRLTGCFSREKAAEWTRDVWTRLGYSPTDKSTWTSERVNMPSHRSEMVQTFAPKAWAAICELLGGEDRVSAESSTWNDGLIVNLGTSETEGTVPDPKELPGWHVDGDLFMHFLDSPEQALLVIPLFNDIQEKAGGTMVCPDAIPKIAKHLVSVLHCIYGHSPNWLKYDHPEGVTPYMTLRGEPMAKKLEFYTSLIQNCSEFHEMTGQTGDVVLLHPLMCHSASVNTLRIPRFITNPPVWINEPFNFDRDDPCQFSLVEKKTMQALGKDRLPGWKITAEREAVVPDRVRIQKMKERELERLRQSLGNHENTNGICCLNRTS